jgi:glycosyltransferase involved in cell wall biosynthesis
MQPPKFSIITPTYKTPAHLLARTWASLKAQTMTDWEWVVWDDTPNSDQVWRQLYGFAADERYCLRAFRGHTHSGSIGEVKRNAAMLANGEIIIELDHDDELTPDCLTELAQTFDDPEIGFAYSDWCEILPDGQSGRYPKGWAFGYGSDYWSDQYGCWVMSAPEINATTISHIVSAPNHVRAWRTTVYRELDGHNPELEIADDYELCVRTFLHTKIARIPKMLYRQHVGPMTAQRQKNALIKQNVRRISESYRDAIYLRCIELGMDAQAIPIW